MRRTPFAVYSLDGAGRDVAVVRYDGDPDAFAALAQAWLADRQIDRSIEPPQPRLYRMNVCNNDEYAWTLGRPERPGRGVWLGATITLTRGGEVSAVVAAYGCWFCEANPGECHLVSCRGLVRDGGGSR